MGDTKLSLKPATARPLPAVAETAAAWPAVGGAQSRHGAIERQVFTYSHYKNWAEKMRNAWKKEDQEAAASEPVRTR